MGKPYSITETTTGAGGFAPAPSPSRPSSAGDAWHFLATFVRHPRTIGAVAPSSRRLAAAMLAAADLESAKVVVELGAGTGAITGPIRRRIGPHATFISMELNPGAVDRLRRRFRGIHVICDSAENLRLHLDLLGLQNADCIISSLPWSSMDAEVQRRVLGVDRRLAAARRIVQHDGLPPCQRLRGRQAFPLGTRPAFRPDRVEQGRLGQHPAGVRLSRLEDLAGFHLGVACGPRDGKESMDEFCSGKGRR